MTSEALARRTENLHPHAPNHPGFDAPDCPLRRMVIAAPYGTSHDGYGCDWTGGHCLPSVKCDDWRACAALESQP